MEIAYASYQLAQGLDGPARGPVAVLLRVGSESLTATIPSAAFVLVCWVVLARPHRSIDLGAVRALVGKRSALERCRRAIVGIFVAVHDARIPTAEPRSRAVPGYVGRGGVMAGATARFGSSTSIDSASSSRCSLRPRQLVIQRISERGPGATEQRRRANAA